MTLKEIAALANVSPATVSLVLNNKPGVGEAKRQEVQALLQKYQYGLPKAGIASARQLLFLKYMRNGLVVEKNTGFVASILDTIEAKCKSLQYVLRIEVCRESLEEHFQSADFSQLHALFPAERDDPPEGGFSLRLRHNEQSGDGTSGCSTYVCARVPKRRLPEEQHAHSELR